MKALIVVDMQNDFIDGALGTKEAVDILPAVKNKIAEYREKGDTVLFTRDTHQENYMETQEGRNLPVPHCLEGTEGWEISPQLDVADSIVVDKPAFGSYELMDVLAEIDEITPLEQIEFIGVCTDICVISNAMLAKARFLEVPVVVDGNCCAGVTPESHERALEAMKMCQIQVMTGGN